MEELKVDDPRTLGRYRILSRLGSGGMGIVYLGEDEEGRRVAVKLIRPELADDQAFRTRFRREVIAAERVGGLCTAKVLEADLDAERPFLVTEYVEGGSLADHIAAHGPLQGDQLVGLAVGLAEAVVAIHAVGVIHRDLKPSNVLMAPDGPKVVDFGISHAADLTAMTQTSVIIGSPAWMAPEQATGHPATPAVDVFSWGATVAFAATGHSPFGEGRPEAVIYRLAHEEPNLNGVDERLLPIVANALAKNPSDRPSPDLLLVSVVRRAMPAFVSPGGNEETTTAVLDQTWRGAPTPSSRRAPGRRGPRIAWLVAIAVALVALGVGVGVGALAPSRNTPKSGTGSRSHASSTTTTTLPATTNPPSTVVTTTVPTRPKGNVLLPASTFPVVDECSITVDTSADGNVSPLFCPDGGINIPAWNWYATSYPLVMGLGPNVSESQVIQTMCADQQRTLPTMEAASQLAARYYGWSFASDPAFSQWPFYPNYQSNECSG